MRSPNVMAGYHNMVDATNQAFTDDCWLRSGDRESWMTKDSSRSPASTYIAASADRTLRTDWMLQAATDRLGVQAATVDSGHCPHVSRPEAVADILTTIRSSRS